MSAFSSQLSFVRCVPPHLVILAGLMGALTGQNAKSAETTTEETDVPFVTELTDVILAGDKVAVLGTGDDKTFKDDKGNTLTNPPVYYIFDAQKGAKTGFARALTLPVKNAVYVPDQDKILFCFGKGTDPNTYTNFIASTTSLSNPELLKAMELSKMNVTNTTEYRMDDFYNTEDKTPTYLFNEGTNLGVVSTITNGWSRIYNATTKNDQLKYTQTAGDPDSPMATFPSKCVGNNGNFAGKYMSSDGGEILIRTKNGNVDNINPVPYNGASTNNEDIAIDHHNVLYYGTKELGNIGIVSLDSITNRYQIYQARNYKQVTDAQTQAAVRTFTVKDSSVTNKLPEGYDAPVYAANEGINSINLIDATTPTNPIINWKYIDTRGHAPVRKVLPTNHGLYFITPKTIGRIKEKTNE